MGTMHGLLDSSDGPAREILHALRRLDLEVEDVRAKIVTLRHHLAYGPARRATEFLRAYA
ncbi:MAG: hypothetical protein ACT4PT_07700 [Methanobacteriota archaeon]